jgi:hypothetical protein
LHVLPQHPHAKTPRSKAVSCLREACACRGGGLVPAHSETGESRAESGPAREETTRRWRGCGRWESAPSGGPPDERRFRGFHGLASGRARAPERIKTARPTGPLADPKGGAGREGAARLGSASGPKESARRCRAFAARWFRGSRGLPGDRSRSAHRAPP